MPNFTVHAAATILSLFLGTAHQRDKSCCRFCTRDIRGSNATQKVDVHREAEIEDHGFAAIATLTPYHLELLA